MLAWMLNHPVPVAVVTFLLMWSDWLLTILQERARHDHYARHYESYPINTIEGNPLLRAGVARRAWLDARHLLVALSIGVGVGIILVFLTAPVRVPFLGYVWGLFLVVDSTHIGNVLGYRASRRGMHGKLLIHQRTGYRIQAARYAGLTVLLAVLLLCTGSAFLAGVTLAALVSAGRQLLWLRRVPAIPEDDAPPEALLVARGEAP